MQSRSRDCRNNGVSGLTAPGVSGAGRSHDDRNSRGLEPSENVDDKAAAAAIEVSDNRGIDELEVARELVRQARDAGVALTGPGGLFKAITKTVIETADRRSAGSGRNVRAAAGQEAPAPADRCR